MQQQEQQNSIGDIKSLNQTFDNIAAALHAEQFTYAKTLLSELHPADLADFFDRNARLRQVIIDLLGTDIGSEALVWLSNSSRKALTSLMPIPDLAELIDELEIDDAIDVINALSDNSRQEIVLHLSQEKQFHIIEGFTYPEHTAGRVMEKDFVAFHDYWTVGQAIDAIRRSHSEKVFYAGIIVDARNRPVGSILLSSLLQNPRNTKLKDLMKSDFKLVNTHVKLDNLSYLFKQYALSIVPVVNKAGKLVGTISVDNMLYIIEEQAEEDIMHMGGVSKQDIFSSLFSTAQHRFPWLFFNLISACITAVIINQFSDTIAHLVTLASLMPIVASMGGNAGTQVMTVTVRALANNDIGSHIGKVIIKEILVCGFNGALLATIGASITFGIFEAMDLSIVFAVAVIINFLVAGLFGAVIPIFLHRIDVDPAAASGVFLTAITDSFGFFSFLTLAYVFLV